MTTRKRGMITPLIHYENKEKVEYMQTAIGLFPKQSQSFMEIVEVMAEEGMYRAFFPDTKVMNSKLNNNLADNIGTIYEEMLLEKGDVGSIVAKSNSKAYSEKIWGPGYKRKEINIIDNASDDEFQVYPIGITADKIIKQNSTQVEELDLFEATDLLLDIEVNLRAMRELHDYFLIHERIDFRALLQNLFREDTNYPEGEELLMKIMQEYASKVKNIVSDYLYHRLNQDIPEEYKETLF